MRFAVCYALGLVTSVVADFTVVEACFLGGFVTAAIALWRWAYQDDTRLKLP